MAEVGSSSLIPYLITPHMCSLTDFIQISSRSRISTSRLDCGASRRIDEWVVYFSNWEVVYFSMLYIFPPPCCIFCQIQRQKRGSEAPREHTLGGSPPAVCPPARRRHAPSPEQTTPRPGLLLYATAEHTSGLQNFLAAEKRAELWRSPAEMHCAA